jgi:hypothetical protein
VPTGGDFLDFKHRKWVMVASPEIAVKAVARMRMPGAADAGAGW